MNYTIQLRDIIESGIELPLHTYPIYDENHRKELNDKIIRRFWYRDIAHETIAQFTQRLETKLHEIMPAYNELYKSSAMLAEFDLFNAVSESTRTVESETESNDQSQQRSTSKDTATAQREQNDTGSTDSTSENGVLNSEYPATGFREDDPLKYASAGTRSYATSHAETTQGSRSSDATASQGASEGESTAHGVTVGKTTETATVKTRSATVADLVDSYRSAIMNIDLMILEELEPLFFQMWGTRKTLYEQPQTYYMPIQWRLF